jgi:hypothetical protein
LDQQDQPEDQEPGHDGMPPAKAQQYAANLAADPSGPAAQPVEEAEAEAVAKEAYGLEPEDEEEDEDEEDEEGDEDATDDDETQSQTQSQPGKADVV